MHSEQHLQRDALCVLFVSLAVLWLLAKLPTLMLGSKCGDRNKSRATQVSLMGAVGQKLVLKIL